MNTYSLIIGLMIWGFVSQAQNASLAGRVYAQTTQKTLPKSKLILKKENIYYKKTKTDHNGNYTFVKLPSGNYSLWIIKEGFCQLELMQIPLVDSQDIHLDLGLVQDAVSNKKMPTSKIDQIYQKPTYCSLIQQDSNDYDTYKNECHIIHDVYRGPTIKIAPPPPPIPPIPREKASHFNDSFNALEKKPGVF